MRKLLWIPLVLAAPVAAQQPPAVKPLTVEPNGQAAAPVVLNPANNRLHFLLLEWEKKMKTVNALEADVGRTETDALSKATKVWQGKAKFLRPDRASLYLRLSTNPDIFEQYVYTGTFLYEYRPQAKTVRIHEMPPPKPGQMLDDSFLSFLVGMKAEEIIKRYGLTLHHEDQHYVYLFIDPKSASDRQEFSKARLALLKATFLPRELTFEAPNGDVVKWDLPKIDVAARITTADFTPPQVPRDWTTQRVPRQTASTAPPPQPSKVRPAGER